MGFRKRPQANQATNLDGDVSNQLGPVSHNGSVKYVGELGENDAPPTYQEAGGAPVESHSPLGYTVGPITILFLNISMMIGTGIYSTPSAILAGTGSVGLSMMYWILGAVISLCSAAVYLEYAAYFSSRSGAEVVNLEQAYPWPPYLFPTAFAMQNIILSFRSSNAIVLADYLFATNGSKGTDWQIKGVAIAGYTVAFLVVLLHRPATPYGLKNALYRTIFFYGGYNNAFNVVNEIRIKRNGNIAILVVMTLCVFANVAFIAAVGKENLESSGTIAASLFFTAVFGSGNPAKGLNFLIALSSFGNMIAVMIGAARMLRECGRPGVLPATRFWVSTWPFGTPAGPYVLDWALTVVIILAIPTGDAFNFVNDLAVLPNSVFNLAMAVGLYIARWRRKEANLPRPSLKAWHPVVIFNILVQLYLVVMPWYPPAGGKGDVSFWYGTYVVTGLGIVLLCGAYYALWVQLLPRWQGDRLRQEVLQLGDGAQTHHLSKVPVDQVEEWDRTHDLTGRTIEDQSPQQSAEKVITSIAGEKHA
ncbi:high-affinity methionine permease [Seiridium cupressi]